MSKSAQSNRERQARRSAYERRVFHPKTWVKKKSMLELEQRQAFLAHALRVINEAGLIDQLPRHMRGQ